MAGTLAPSDLRVLWDDAKLLPAYGATWGQALAVLEEGRDFERGARWGVYNIQRLYLEFLEALGLRERPLRATLSGESSSSTSSESLARRSLTSRRSTSIPNRDESTRHSPVGLSTKHLATTQNQTRTSATPCRTPSP